MLSKNFFWYFLVYLMGNGDMVQQISTKKLWHNVSLSQLAVSQETAHVWLGSIWLRLGCKWTPSTIPNLLQDTGFVPQPPPVSSCPRAILPQEATWQSCSYLSQSVLEKKGKEKKDLVVQRSNTWGQPEPYKQMLFSMGGNFWPLKSNALKHSLTYSAL